LLTAKLAPAFDFVPFTLVPINPSTGSKCDYENSNPCISNISSALPYLWRCTVRWLFAIFVVKPNDS
jgi:hypothetical protein